MMGYRDATKVVTCDGCHNVIRGKEPRTVKRRGQPDLHFHNRRCEGKYTAPKEYRCQECGVRVASSELTCRNGHVLVDPDTAGVTIKS